RWSQQRNQSVGASQFSPVPSPPTRRECGESFGLAVDQYGNLELGMQVLAVGAMTVGPAAGTFAFDKGAGQHFTERTEPTDELAAQFQVRVGRRFHMTLILVSEKGKSQAPRRFAKMPPNRTWSRNPVNKRTGAAAV